MVETTGQLLEELTHIVPLPAAPTVVKVGPVRVGRYRFLYVHVFSDVDTFLTVQYSIDGINFATESTLSMTAHVGTGDAHRSRVKGEWVQLFISSLGGAGTVFESTTFAIPIK